MKFVDQARIYIRSGNGGNGCLSFRRERFIPKGGPDGGDGGRGGDVILVASSHVQTLLDFHNRYMFIARKGGDGKGKNQHGKDAPDLILKVPCGTLIYDHDRGILLDDLVEDGQRFIAARGGKGGKGNARFAHPTLQAPRKFERGQKGEERWLRLEMKLIADIGLIGFPNSGKSTILSRVSNARPPVAPYPFTTIQPYLGVVEREDGERFVMADIPGLIKGAHSGAGLGTRFLRHIERTLLLIHVIDISPLSGREPIDDLDVIKDELYRYSPSMAEKPRVIVLNKIDMLDDREWIASIKARIEREGLPVFPISALTGEGTGALVQYLFERLSTYRSVKREVSSA